MRERREDSEGIIEVIKSRRGNPNPPEVRTTVVMLFVRLAEDAAQVTVDVRTTTRDVTQWPTERFPRIDVAVGRVGR